MQGSEGCFELSTFIKFGHKIGRKEDVVCCVLSEYSRGKQL